MAVTQSQIARRVGLDVSSVNKILNRTPGPIFKKETIKRVFKVARELGYDLGRLKYRHRRRNERKDMDLSVEIAIYNADGTLYDRGTARLRDVSLSGARLSALVLPQQAIPLRPHTIGIRLLDGAEKDFEAVGRVVRFSHSDNNIVVGIEFTQTKGLDLKRLRRIVG